MADADLALRDDVEKYAKHSPNSSGHDQEKGLGGNSPYNGENERRSSIGLPGYEGAGDDRKGSVTIYHDGFFSCFSPASFKRNPNARVVTEATDNEGRPLPDQPPAEPALAMKLKGRHLQMIAIGGSIGEPHATNYLMC